MAKIKWSEAKAEYIADETVSYRDIARKFGVNQATVSKRAKREEWIKLRAKTQAEGNQKTLEKMGGSIAEVNTRHVKTALLLQEKGVNSIKKRKLRPRNFDQALRSIDKGIDIERKALGIDKPVAPIGPSQPNTIINYFDFKNRYGDRRRVNQLPVSD